MIYTFYSYKGGVGRSMALANVAECFCRQGLDVVMVDWDLEAPGLESFFFDPEPEEPAAGSESSSTKPLGERPPLAGIALVQSKLGLIDMLTEYKRSYSSILPPQENPQELPVPKAFQKYQSEDPVESKTDGNEFVRTLNEHMPPLSTYLVPIHEKPKADDATGSVASAGSLSLLPAGWRFKERFQAYGQAVQSFDWDGFYASYRGKEYFNWLRGKLLQEAQVVLIDSRTGVTEMGGVCTREMADVVVSFSAPNNQNIDGVARMVRSFRRTETLEARDKRPLDTIIVPTRVDPSELDDLRKFQERFERLADEKNCAPEEFRDLERKFWDLQIPYRAKSSYQERRAIGPDVTGNDPTKGLENAYWKLACHLALLAPETHKVRQSFADRLQQEFPALLPKVVLSYLQDGAQDAVGVQAYMHNAGIKLWPDLLHESGSDDFERSTSFIGQAKHLVVVLSEGALADTGIIRRELRFARQQGTTVHVMALSVARPFRTWLQPSEIYTSLTAQFLDRLRTAPRGLRSPVLAPPVPPGYVERPAVQQQLIADLLETASSTGRQTVALWGQGGSGKTALAARLCQDEDIVDAYAGGIFFVNAGEPAAASRILAAISPETTVSDAPTAVATVAGLLRGRRCLFIIDDVWSDKDIGWLLNFTEPCTILALTRDLKVATNMASKVVKLDSLTQEEAESFLPAGAEIAERLGRLPLALALVRAALQQEGTLSRSGEDALESARERLRRHGVVAFDQPGDDRNQSVARSIEFTLARLQNWERKRFDQLAVLCAAGSTTVQNAQEMWTASPAGPGEPRPLGGRQMEALCQRFSELSLAIWEPKTQSISLPGMIRDYLRAQGSIGQPQSSGVENPVSSGRDREHNEDVTQARRILGGLDIPFEELTALAKRLKTARYFSYARQLYGRIRRVPQGAERRVYWAQQHALCTYKDPDLPYIERADRALEILGEVQNLNETKDQETLGLAGAIFKYKWAADGQRLNLERSLAYYRRGYQEGVEKDYGYTGINAAFVLDLIAAQEESESKKAGSQSATTLQRRTESHAIREDIAAHVPGLARLPGKECLEKEWWFLATIAEAFFGLERCDEARYWLREALAVEVADWEFESTARQLARLALLQNQGKMPAEDSPAFHTLRVFLGNDANALRSIAAGKVGLALSGGGFRASLFHIGVLAKLAELDVLRHVEVLSCVSGGSIVGAHYYLEVKRLLEAKADAEITRSDYIELVKRIERDFLEGIQANLRMRLAANPLANLATFIWPHYTLTDRLGDLFEKKLYSQAAGKGPLFLDNLLIRPKGSPEGFAPKLDNWHRAAKVPMLILNATTLNTGHNWQFTATWMGEPPAGVMKEVDGNDLLRRMYYWEAPKNHRTIRLGRAVAASACVPGLFDPVEFVDLYPKRTIRLVDGGVHDNQGTGGLLEQECSVLLVSDASGQMSSQSHPGAEQFQVPLRASSILGARVREAQYLDLDGRRRSTQVKGLMFVHLKKGLDAEPVDWVDCIDPFDVTDDARPKERRGPLTGYGILKTVQRRLAAIRTDLDSFTDVEAYALMLSGYRMTEHEFPECVEDIPVSNAQTDDWRFLSVEKAMSRAKDFEEAHDHLMDILKAGESRAFKIWRLSRGLGVSGLLLLLTMALLFLESWIILRPAQGLNGRGYLIPAVVLGIPAMAWLLFRIAKVRKPFTRLLSGLILGIAGWIVALFHLWAFDPGFLAWGRVKSKPYSGAGAGAVRRPLLAFAVAALVLVLNPLTMAYLAQVRGDFAAARDNWNWVLSLTSAREAYLGRALANRELGSYPAALADYDRALGLGANPASVYRDRAYTNVKAGDYRSAASDCDHLRASTDAGVIAGCEKVRALLSAQSQQQPKLAPPIIVNARVELLSGKPNPDKDLEDLRAEFSSSGYRVIEAKPLVDPGRPDVPEVRYFSPQDRSQAEIIAQFLTRKLARGVSPNTYKDPSAKPGYLEVWLGR